MLHDKTKMAPTARETKDRRTRVNQLACENICFSSLFAARDVSRGGTSATQRQKFHTDDANQCLHNESSSHGFQI